MKRSLVFLLSCVLLVFGVLFEGCKDGQELEQKQQQTEETAKGVAGEPTPPDPCESEKNKDNIMCSWVLQTVEGTVGGGQSKYKAVSEFDEKGRTTLFKTLDGSENEIQRITYFYSEHGPFKIIQLSEPNPLGSENFTYETTTDTYYNPGGSIDKKEVTFKTNQNTTGSTTSLYDYTGGGMPGSHLLMTHELKNNVGVKYGENKEYFFKDPQTGKTVKKDKRNFPDLTLCKLWEISTYGYNSDNRINSIRNETEDCAKSTPNGDCTNNPITPHSINQTTQINYDDKGRLTLLEAMVDGDPSQNPPQMPDGNPEGSITMEFKYEMVTQNPANEHPVLGSDPLFKDLGLGSRDVMTSLEGKFSAAGPGISMKMGWVRLWQALPGGQAPE